MKETMLSKYLNISPIEANKIEMAVLYLLINCKKKFIFKTYIYKFIASLEIEAAKKYANHFFEMDFVAWEKGPVPISFLNYVEKNKGKFLYFKYLIEDETKTKFYLEDKKNNCKEFSWDYFLEEETKILKYITTIFNEYLGFQKTNDVIEYTHYYSKSWQDAWKKAVKERKKTYDLDFSLDINTDELDESEKDEIIKLYKESKYGN
ncbi:Panacea domain-containing protein [Spiroplasma citri]|uniref:Panacea domain-containing protein n=1 Tax=Spiroplasma citri TaxID=2133 RepID=A0AAX3T0A7_SPICI|nr:type II toxin-antitoxin system antitoxin SocA domain-containing protein [Spiroplasma citri]WFG97037.1 Panacea domain-containing protein [Spiroplasma citri]